MPGVTPRFRATAKPKSGPRALRWFFLILLAAGIGTGAAWFVGPRVRIEAGRLYIGNGDTGVRNVVWGTPQSLGNNINTTAQEYEPCVSSDGSELFFVRGKPGQGAHLYYSARRSGQWTDPAPLTAINGPTDDLGPRLSADGRFLFFYSDRPGGLGGYDIWAAQRSPDGSWGKPFNLGPTINSEFNEYSPDPTPDGKHLIFSTNRTAAQRDQSESWHATIRQTNSTDYDLWIAELAEAPTSEPGATTETAAVPPLAYQPAREIPGINTPYAEGSSSMSPAGDFLYFASNRPGGYGKFDLYRCRVNDWTFGSAQNLGPSINTADNELDPCVAMGGYRLYFSSDRSASRGGYDIFSSDSREVSVTNAGYPLPHLGWGGWVMLASLIVLVPLLLFLRGSDQRFSYLQQALLISVLIHALISFGLSFVMVSQHVAAYVKQETGFDLNLSLPKSIELALAVRNPHSSEGPQAAGPRSLNLALLPVQTPSAPAALPLNVPLEPTVSGRGAALPVALPPLAPAVMPAPSAAAPTLTLAPMALPPAPTPPAHPVSQLEIQPSFSLLPPAATAAPELPAPQVVRHGFDLPTAPANHPAKPLLDRGSDALAAAPPMPTPQLGAALPVGPAAGGSPAAGPAIAAPTLMVTPLLPSADAGAGNDAFRGRDIESGAAQTSVRFAPLVQSSDAQAGNLTPSIAAAVPKPALTPPAPTPKPPPLQLAAALPLPKFLPPPPAPPPVIAPPKQKVVAVTPFRRAPAQRSPLIAKFGGTPQSEAAVSRALAWLARVQEPDGHWGLMQEQALPGKRKPGPHDMAYTGLALLAFLAQDHSPDKPDLYRETVRKGLNFILSNQSDDGDLRGPPEFRGGASGQANMYDHAIATLAVAEAALLDHDENLAASARAAASFILSAQDPESGGWRYAPQESGDSSVFGWEVMALHDAELLGFQVPPTTRSLALHYINNASGGEGGLFAGYQPGTPPTQTMTAEMLFARMLLGERFGEDATQQAGDFLAQYPPNAEHPDLYYWYYASLCMFQLKAPNWSQWNVRTREALIQLQSRGGFADGCWEVMAKKVDNAGFVFTTSIATLTLEVYYRYAPAVADKAGQ